MGSKVGGFFTILLYASLLSYFSYLVQRMYNGFDDNIKTQLSANDLVDGNNQIKIANSSLLPSMQLVLLKETVHSKNVMKHDGIDFDELNKYI